MLPDELNKDLMQINIDDILLEKLNKELMKISIDVMFSFQIVDIGETLALFMELQTLGDRVLRKLAFSHIIHSIRRMNQKHKNDTKNRALQNILFSLLQVWFYLFFL